MSQYLKNQYIYLHPLAANEDIKKFQNFFKKLKIYKWNIDWKYNSIKSDIINFQLKNKIISSEKDEWAGYIWAKTYNFLTKKYWNNFQKIYDIFLTNKRNKKPWIKQCFIISAYYSPLLWPEKDISYLEHIYLRSTTLSTWRNWTSFGGFLWH